MIPIALLPDLPDCRVEQVNSSLEAVIITASATQEGASCPDCSLVFIAGSQLLSALSKSPAVSWTISSSPAPRETIPLFPPYLSAQDVC